MPLGATCEIPRAWDVVKMITISIPCRRYFQMNKVNSWVLARKQLS
jgi:hypothetical protein